MKVEGGGGIDIEVGISKHAHVRASEEGVGSVDGLRKGAGKDVDPDGIWGGERM